MEVGGRDVGETELQVLGVYKDLPAFSRFDFQFMTNVRQFAKDHPRWTSWGGSAFWTYFKIKDDTNPTNLQTKIAGLVGENGGRQSLSLYLQNIGDSYLYSQFENGQATSGRITYVRIFFFAALFLMLMACINFVNLATVQATRRAGEVGVRKVLGASILSIVGLLSKELLKLISIAFLVAIPITYYFTQDWLQYFEYRVTIQWWLFVVAGLGMILIALATLSFQGIRATVVNPVASLKNE